MENADIQRLEKVKFFLDFKSFSAFSRAIGLNSAQIFTDISIKANRKRDIRSFAVEAFNVMNGHPEGDMHGILIRGFDAETPAPSPTKPQHTSATP